MEDDVYKGMHIPKGSLVFGNIWYVLMPSVVYFCHWLAALCYGLVHIHSVWTPTMPISYSMPTGR